MMLNNPSPAWAMAEIEQLEAVVRELKVVLKNLADSVDEKRITDIDLRGCLVDAFDLLEDLAGKN